MIAITAGIAWAYTSLDERVWEATERGWLGEIEGLQVRLDAARRRWNKIRRTRTRAIPLELSPAPHATGPDQARLHPRAHRPGHIVYEPVPDEQHLASRALRGSNDTSRKTEDRFPDIQRIRDETHREQLVHTRRLRRSCRRYVTVPAVAGSRVSQLVDASFRMWRLPHAHCNLAAG